MATGRGKLTPYSGRAARLPAKDGRARAAVLGFVEVLWVVWLVDLLFLRGWLA